MSYTDNAGKIEEAISTLPKILLPTYCGDLRGVIEQFFSEDPKKWAWSPSLLEIDGHAVFAIYGMSGGISVSYIFYIVAQRHDQRPTHEALAMGIEFKFIDWQAKPERINGAIHKALEQVAQTFETKARVVNMSGGDLGRGDVIVTI